MKILVCFGTRPEFIKIKSLIEEFSFSGIHFQTCYIKQHTSLLKNQEFDYEIEVKQKTDNRLNDVISSILSSSIFCESSITHILVQGDTATAFACALAAFNANKKIIHLEAGLRTYDKENPFPEETYRQSITRLADIHLCPTESNKKNIIEEKGQGVISVVGNTGLDSILNLRNKTFLNERKNILVTLHRRENHLIINEWFKELNNLAAKNKTLNFIFPIHPNPNVQKYKDILTDINVVEPLEHSNLLKIICDSKLIITDSGGIQEEASFLGRNVIVCRKVTERNEVVNISSFLCEKPQQLELLFQEILSLKDPSPSNVYGDGYASKKIVAFLKNHENF